MTAVTATDVLVLHAVRTRGFADADRIAQHLLIPADVVRSHLLDAEAHGWATHSSFAGSAGWALTEMGKRHGEQQLAAELDLADVRAAVEGVYRDFLPLNDIVGAVCTAWQLAGIGMGEAPTDLRSTIAALERPADALRTLEARLTTHLVRFSGYHRRFDQALQRAQHDPAWITATDRDSCHLVWFQLHEDLLATLGLAR